MKIKTFESTDTNVKKFVFEWGDQPSEKKGVAEAVLYRYGEYRKRTVICCCSAKYLTIPLGLSGFHNPSTLFKEKLTLFFGNSALSKSPVCVWR